MIHTLNPVKNFCLTQRSKEESCTDQPSHIQSKCDNKEIDIASEEPEDEFEQRDK